MKDTQSTALAVFETPSNIQNLDMYTAGEIIARRESLMVELSAAIKNLKRNILDVGRILAELRQVTPYGDWEKVLGGICADLDISRSSAHVYIDAHEKISSLTPEVVTTCREANIRLDSPSKLNAVVNAFIENPDAASAKIVQIAKETLIVKIEASTKKLALDVATRAVVKLQRKIDKLERVALAEGGGYASEIDEVDDKLAVAYTQYEEALAASAEIVKKEVPTPKTHVEPIIPDAEYEDDIVTLPDLPELDEAVKNPVQHKPLNPLQPAKPAGTISDIQKMRQKWDNIRNPAVGGITITAANVSSGVETAAGRYDLKLAGVTPAMMKKLYELLSCN